MRHQVDGAVVDLMAGQVVEERLDEGFEAWPEVGGAPGGEGGGDEPAQAQVLRCRHLGHGPHVRQAVLGDAGRRGETAGGDLEAGVVEHGPGVVVAGQHPQGEAGGADTGQRSLLTGAAVGGEGIRDDVGAGEVDLGDTADHEGLHGVDVRNR
ncbi:hypothetical protein [Nonomuraea recticatena]|uniref:hypothetical protein n=1 Tax=Nonomuraea recticatena TaxID=46178 RepID=UPI00361C8FC7